MFAVQQSPLRCRIRLGQAHSEASWLSSDRVVLVDEAAKHIVTIDVMAKWGSRASPTRRHLEVDASVRSLAVVMAHVLSKHSLEVAMAKDEHPVETFGPDGFHPAFRVGIGPRRPNWGLDHPNAF